MSAYSDVKEVANDAWSVGSGIAPYVFGEKDLSGTPTEPANGHMEDAQDIPPGQTGNPYQPTSGNKTFDSVLNYFM
jgi:hypothetical protein